MHMDVNNIDIKEAILKSFPHNQAAIFRCTRCNKLITISHKSVADFDTVTCILRTCRELEVLGKCSTTVPYYIQHM